MTTDNNNNPPVEVEKPDPSVNMRAAAALLDQAKKLIADAKVLYKDIGVTFEIDKDFFTCEEPGNSRNHYNNEDDIDGWTSSQDC